MMVHAYWQISWTRQMVERHIWSAQWTNLDIGCYSLCFQVRPDLTGLRRPGDIISNPELLDGSEP